MYLFVAALGYSRRLYVRTFRSERQESWFAMLEGAFRHFGGVPKEVLFDNDRGLVVRHNRQTRGVEFNAHLHAFARHSRFRPRAYAPYRARTKEGRARRRLRQEECDCRPPLGFRCATIVMPIARGFDSWSAFEAHLDTWAREIADQRVHGTTGAVPIERFWRVEANVLRSIAGIPPFAVSRETSSPSSPADASRFS